VGVRISSLDDLNRLVSAASSAGACAGMNLAWGYDRYGNRWNQSASGTTGCAIVQPNLTFNGGNNRIDSYSYDAAGNVLNDGVHTYTYDAENRVIQVDGGAAAYTYDAEGRRVRKDVGSAAAEYIYFGGQVIAEHDPYGGGWVDYIYGNGRLLARSWSWDPSDTVYYHGDHLGTVRLATDAGGNVVSNCTYLPFGTLVGCSPDDAANHYRFTGMEHDSETGLDHTWFRQHSPLMGRWLTPDPAGLAAVDLSKSAVAESVCVRL